LVFSCSSNGRGAGPSGDDWRRLLRLYGAHGRAESAVSLAATLEGEGTLARDEATFAALIAAGGRSKAAPLAEALFDEMRYDKVGATAALGAE
jgi:hypothetical protein